MGLACSIWHSAWSLVLACSIWDLCRVTCGGQQSHGWADQLHTPSTSLLEARLPLNPSVALQAG